VTEDTLATILAWPMWFFLAWQLPRWWRMPPPGPRVPRSFSALVRAFPAGALAFLVLIPPVFVHELVAEDSPVWIVCRGLIAVGGLAAITVIPAVILFNRPSFIVAPALRALPGLLTERRG